MDKSVYSLVLMDEVVDKIDIIARSHGTNRSALINEILAEFAGVKTLDYKVKTILNIIDKNMDKEAAIHLKSKSEGNSLNFKSALKYKYNPSINYMISLDKNNQNMVVLKISSRSKSEDFYYMMEQFLKLIDEVERENEVNVKEAHSKEFKEEVNNKFLKEFTLENKEEEISERFVAEYISYYLAMIDKCMKYYFMNKEDDKIKNRIKEMYTIEFIEKILSRGRF